MKVKNLIYLIALILIACEPGNELEPEFKCSLPGPPAFDEDPKVFNNIHSIQFRFKTDRPANIYYVVTENELTDKSPSIIKSYAENGGVLKSGSYQVDCNNLDASSSFVISGLPQDKTLYAYLTAESLSDKTLQEKTTAFVFTTTEGLATQSFHSQVKNRKALYVRHLPKAVISGEAGQLHPLLIFLGGNSEVSPAGEITVIQNGSPLVFVNKGNDLPFIVIGPEHNTNNWRVDFLHEVINHAIENFPVDPDRINITGLSGGGNGALNYAMKYPEVPASIVPIGGWATEPGLACQMTEMAVWLIHNENDQKVSTQSSVKLYEALQECTPPPSKEVKLTLFKDPGHNAWYRIYDPGHNDWNKDPSTKSFNVYEWMYEQRR